MRQFTEDFARTLRESAQSHRRITWVFAGSHHFSELPNVRWSSYLVSLRTLELPPFTPEDDALRLTLKRHLLVKEAADGQWALRVPLMQRWLRERM